MSATIAIRNVRDRRHGLIGWGVGMVALVLTYALFYPSIRENAGDLQRYIDNLPEALRNIFGESADFATPTGYLQTELFSTMGPLLLLILAIGAGARAIAGEEEARTLDLLLANPVRRRRVVLEKFGALLATTFAVGALLWVSIAAFGPPFELHVGLAKVAAATVSAVLLAIAFGAIALFLGCLRGSRALATGVTSALAVGTFLLNALAPSIAGIEFLEKASPFYYYMGGDPLRNGLTPVHGLVLVGIAAAALMGAIAVFDRRDLAA